VRSADDASPLIARGSWEGRIALRAAGAGGFGYDPLFIPEGHQVTAAELPSAQKNALSHRARALASLVAQIGRGAL
jgi:XTP/dITP diphosphohydrolase